MSIARKDTGKRLPASARPRAKALEDHAFGRVGSRIPDLIAAEELDEALDDEALAALLEAAKVPEGDLVFSKKTITKRAWFVREVKAAVRDWLKEQAHRPPVREVANELIALKHRLYDALASEKPADLLQAAALYEGLSLQARSDIDAGGHLKLPDLQHIRAGDPKALNRLFGLIPVQPGASGGKSTGHPFERDPRFTGSAAGELSQRGQPRSVRFEQLATTLAVIYEVATGRHASRGARSHFEHFFNLLLSFLLQREMNDQGDQLLRRVVRRPKL